MKGLTIFEVLVSILIFSIIALGLGYAVVAGKSALLVSDIPTQLRGNVLFAIMSMDRELRQAVPSKTVPKAEESSNSITFQVARYNEATGVINFGQPITYQCNGCSSTVPGQLTRISGGATLVIAPNIVTPNGLPIFSRKDVENSLIIIDINAQKSDGQGRLYHDTEQAIVKMRN
ncbi:MAG: hypothetical protein NTX01_08840 [Candidatus Omnitrophica bacterium]|nr:hypothetical protein [Candidatus Omnitrophota bacterium]